MKNRLISSFIAAVMLLAAIPTVTGAGYSDIEGHWGKRYIEQVTQLHLFGGVSESEFDPDGVMTRGMFVTVLGRLEGIDLDYWGAKDKPRFFNDVSPEAYYAPYICWAVCNGIADGMENNCFAPDEPVTREQMSKLTAFYAERLGHRLTALEGATIVERFADEAQISGWAVDSVERLRSLGILNGMTNAAGELCFMPSGHSTRAECAALFCRLYEALQRGEAAAFPTSVQLNVTELRLNLGETFALSATVFPESDAKLVWRSSAPDIATVDNTGLIRCVGSGSAVVSVCTPNGLYASCQVICGGLASASESYEEKCLRIFGEVIDDPRLYYLYTSADGETYYDYAAAAGDMVEITVEVWDLAADGTKFTRTFPLQVHKNIAPTVRAIFKEIYDGDEQFPIHALLAYGPSGKSEHTIGCAIDINPNENYYYNPSTGQIVGEYWLPGEDPYSIPLDGEVARIFEKYGFRQGAYWNSGTKDYMHFSYFGT